MKRINLQVALIVALFGGCITADEQAVDEVECGEDCEGLAHRIGPQLIQSGSEILLLAVTADRYAVYQEGQTVYATGLWRNAKRTFVTDVPGDNVAFALFDGDVAFLWTAPQRDLPGFGVSPLVLWSSKSGPQLISEQSAVGTVATAVSSDSRQVVYMTNVSDDGMRGDIVHARTRDARSSTTLLSDVILGFPSARCRPLAGFAGKGARSFPVAAYCAGTDTTATLSTWKHGKKTDLIANIATPMPFTLESDPRGRAFIVDLADGTNATVSTSGKIDVIGNALPFGNFINRKRTAVYVGISEDGTQPELRVKRRNGEPKTVGPMVAIYQALHNGQGYYRRQTSSRDGRMALYASDFDPATGLTDMQLLDIRTATAQQLDGELRTTIGRDLFTTNSQYALYFRIEETSSTGGALYSANRFGETQKISSGNNVFDVARARGRNVSYSENPTFNPAREFQLSTADIVVADAKFPDKSRRTVSEQAYLFYLPTVDRRRLVFSSGGEADGPGLYLTRSAP